MYVYIILYLCTRPTLCVCHLHTIAIKFHFYDKSVVLHIYIQMLNVPKACFPSRFPRSAKTAFGRFPHTVNNREPSISNWTHFPTPLWTHRYVFFIVEFNTSIIKFRRSQDGDIRPRSYLIDCGRKRSLVELHNCTSSSLRAVDRLWLLLNWCHVSPHRCSCEKS